MYSASDSAAILAQKRYFHLLRAKIAILIVIAILASFTWERVPQAKTAAAMLIAVILIVATLASVLMDLRKYDHSWFICRAIAESVKSETFKFVMRADPYTGSGRTHTDEEQFLRRLREILHRQQAVPGELAEQAIESTQITDEMRRIREMNLEDRRSYYARDRIRGQRDWYGKKARWNQSRENVWFYIAYTLQALAVTASVVMISLRDFPFNAIPVLTTSTAGALSWYHARSYRELSQSYALVAQELGILQDQASHMTTEQRLAEIVLEVERTISREHTMWLTRRLPVHET